MSKCRTMLWDMVSPSSSFFLLSTYKHILASSVLKLHADPHSFTDPESFIPERWYSKPELILHKDAFIPFSTGPFGCIGKNLAYMEMRTLTAQIVMKFDVSLAPGEDGERLLRGSRDHFTMHLEELRLCFTERERA